MNEKQERLSDYLKKPSGYINIITVIITAILTLIVSFWVTSHFQDKKELTIQESQYNFLTRNELDESDVNQHIKVYYDGKEIYNPHVIKVVITNTGNQEITIDDFKNDKFEVSFNKNIILYDASISNATPSNVQEEIVSGLEIRNNCLLISPFLLNANESFTLSLITNQETDIYYNFRIAGISNIKKEPKIYVKKSFLFIPQLLIFLCLSTNTILLKFSKRKSLIILIYILMFIILLVLTFAFISYFTNYLIKPENMRQFIFK